MYNAYYGFQKSPFENSPDPDFLYLSKNPREVLASLTYGIQAAKGFIVVAGDIGTGKTTLIHAFLREMSDNSIVLNIINPRATFDDMVRYVAKKLGIHDLPDNRLEAIDILKVKLDEIDKEDKRVVFIIDEAHLLSEQRLEDIRLLSNIENVDRKLLQIVLVGQNEIYTVLERKALLPLKQRIVIHRRLYPLSKAETTDYIHHRLHVAGGRESLFDAKAIQLIWKLSQGIPRLINQFCDNALLIGFATEAMPIGPHVIQEVFKDMRETLEGPNRIRRFLWGTGTVLTAIVAGLITAKLIMVADFTVDASLATKVHPSRLPAVTKRLRTDVSPPAIPVDPGGGRATDVMGLSKNTANPILNGLAKEPQKNDEQAKGNAPPLVSDEKGESVPHGENPAPELNLQKRMPSITIVNRPVLEYEDYIVKANQWLRTIAKSHYGMSNATIIDIIHMINPEIRDINKIHVGQRIHLPKIVKETFIHKASDEKYYIHHASFYHHESAEIYMKEHRRRKKIFMIKAFQGVHTVYRIYEGPYMTLKAGSDALASMESDHISAHIGLPQSL